MTSSLFCLLAITDVRFSYFRESFDRLKPLIAPEGDFKIIQQAEDTLNEQHKRRQREQERAVAELDCETYLPVLTVQEH
jgi:hypothetical protein